MQKLRNKKVLIMFVGWACALVLILTLTCASLAKYVSGKSAENNANTASLDCTVETSVRSASGSTASFVNYGADLSGYQYLLMSNGASVVDYVITNHSEVSLHPYFRIYGSYEFLSKMAFQLAKVTTETVSSTDGNGEETTVTSTVDTAITPQYYMSSILNSDEASATSSSWTFGTDDKNMVEKLDYDGGEETVTVKKEESNSVTYYTAQCTNKTSNKETASITVTETSVSQNYTIMFSRGVATKIGTDSDGKEIYYNDKSAKSVYYEATTDTKKYLCLTVELPNIVLSPGESARYACYLVATGNVSQDLLSKSLNEIEGATFNGWYYDAEITPTTGSTEAVTVRIKGAFSTDGDGKQTTTASYYLVNADGKETPLTKSDEEENATYSGGGYTFGATALEKYGEYTYNPNDETDNKTEQYSLDVSWGVIYPLRATILFEQTQGVA